MGILTFIVDTNIHSNPSFNTRKYLIEKTRILQIIDGLQAFENAASSQMILLCQKHQHASEYNVIWKKFDNNIFHILTERSVGNILSNKELSFKLPIDNRESEIVSIIGSNTPLVNIIGNKFVRTCITFTGKKDEFVQNKKERQIDYPLIEGSRGVKSAYSRIFFDKYVRYDLELRDKLNKAYREEAILKNRRSPKVIGLGDLRMFKAPKLFIRLSDTRLTATYTKEHVCADLSLYIICLPNFKERWKSYSLFYILAIINSKLMTFYFIKNNFIRNLGTGTPQIRLKDLRRLPLKGCVSFEKFDLVVTYALHIKEYDSQIFAYIECLIDAMVYELYFPNEIKAVNGEILKHLNNLSELKENWTDEKKSAAIKRIYQELSNPMHPVALAIEKQRSVPEVRIVEGLST